MLLAQPRSIRSGSCIGMTTYHCIALARVQLLF